jgi:hypothetical protein
MDISRISLTRGNNLKCCLKSELEMMKDDSTSSHLSFAVVEILNRVLKLGDAGRHRDCIAGFNMPDYIFMSM